jgi:hypothetical protein
MVVTSTRTGTARWSTAIPTSPTSTTATTTGDRGARPGPTRRVGAAGCSSPGG